MCINIYLNIYLYRYLNLVISQAYYQTDHIMLFHANFTKTSTQPTLAGKVILRRVACHANSLLKDPMKPRLFYKKKPHSLKLIS